MLKLHNPHIVFITETKLSKEKMSSIKRKCGFLNGIEFEFEGSRGGLWLAWNANAKVNLKSYPPQHIVVEIEDEQVQLVWQLTEFYGSPFSHNKEASWNLLRHLGRAEVLPWLVCGDFNEILYGFKKEGGLPRNERRMEAFRNVLFDCQLDDIGYEGNR